jgi:endoglucanase
MVIKSLRPLLVLGLPLLFAGCTMWKPTPKPAPSSAATPKAATEGATPRNSEPAAPTRSDAAAAAQQPGGTENKFVPVIDISTPYGSVKRHGRLLVVGNRIVGEHGMPVSLAGNSFFWSQWQGQFFNAEIVKWLKFDWKSAIVRVPLGVEGKGYLDHPEAEQARVCELVDAAIAADMYVIIDWHDHHAHQHTVEAVKFFQAMALKYGQSPNVLYEIFNEPTKEASWARDVKPYAEEVIAAIRALDPDNMIIVGSPTWSQDVDVVADNPIKAKNIAYSLHFYAGTHKQWLRDKALVALQKGLPLFVTEWGTCNADGKGAIDEISTREWMDFMQQWGLSHCNWAVSDKVETASIVKPNASAQGHWSSDDLTPSGRLAREWTRSWAAAADAQ